MNQGKYQLLISGNPIQLSSQDLQDLMRKVDNKPPPLEDINCIARTLYKTSPQQTLDFLTYIADNILLKEQYNSESNNSRKSRVYNYLTVLCLDQASCSSEQNRSMWVDLVRKYLNQSQKSIGGMDISILINRAFYYFYEGDLTKASQYASKIYSQASAANNNQIDYRVAILLLQAQISFAKRNYAKAIEDFQTCLKLKNTLPINARIAMAYCLFYLNEFQMAKYCFQRVLKLSPNNCEAYIGLAVIHHRNQDPQQYFNNLKQAYKINKEHPLILLHLAEHFLIRKQQEKAIKYCDLGLLQIQKFPKFITKKDGIRNDYDELYARFLNIKGQVFHQSQNYEMAMVKYQQVSKPGLLWNDLQLAQCLTYLKKYQEAAKIIDEIYTSFNRSKDKNKDIKIIRDCLRMFTFLKIRVHHKQTKENAQFFYGEAIKYNKQDNEMKAEMAHYLFDSNPHKSHRLLQEIEASYKTQNKPCPPQILLNISTMLIVSHQYEQAEERIKHLLENIQTCSLDNIAKAGLSLIARFNYGIVFQKLQDNQKSLNIYKKILETNKYHLDSYLRMAVIYQKLGNIDQSLKYLSKAESVCAECEGYHFKGNKVDRVHILRVYLLSLEGQYEQAIKSINKLSTKTLYSTLLQKSMQYDTIMRKGLKMNQLKNYLRPMREYCFRKMEEDPHSAFIVMLTAVILTTDRKLSFKDGNEFFSSIKVELQQDLPSVLYNLALFYLKYEEYQSSLAILSNNKQRIGKLEGEQLIAITMLITGKDIQRILKIVKLNVMRQPGNIKYRWQHYFILEYKCRVEKEVKSLKSAMIEEQHIQNYKIMQICCEFYNFISRMDIEKKLKGIKSLEKRNRSEVQLKRIKQYAEENRQEVFKLKKIYEQKDANAKISPTYLAHLAKKEEQKLSYKYIQEYEKQAARKAQEERLKRQKIIEQAKKTNSDMGEIFTNANKQSHRKEEERRRKREYQKNTDTEEHPVSSKRKRTPRSERTGSTTPVKIKQEYLEDEYNHSTFNSNSAVKKQEIKIEAAQKITIKREENKHADEEIKKYLL